MIFLTPFVLSLVVFCLVVCLFFIAFFGARDYGRMIFSERERESSTVYMGYCDYIRATAGHELGTLNIRVHNSLTVHDNF